MKGVASDVLRCSYNAGGLCCEGSSEDRRLAPPWFQLFAALKGVASDVLRCSYNAGGPGGFSCCCFEGSRKRRTTVFAKRRGACAPMLNSVGVRLSFVRLRECFRLCSH